MPRQQDVDYLNSIPGDEPVFIMRAKDNLAIKTVGHWLELAALAKVATDKITGVVDNVLQPMSSWRAANEDKIKDPD